MSVVDLVPTNTNREATLGRWGTEAVGFATVRDAVYGSVHNTIFDLALGTFWNTATNRIYVYRTFIQFPVPSGTSTSGKKATLKLYARANSYPRQVGPAAPYIHDDVDVPDIQVFECDSIPNITSAKRYVYSSFTSTSYSSQVTGISSEGGWLEIELNSDALTAIGNAAGSTFDLCIREYAHDIGNSDPGISSGRVYFLQFASMKVTELKPRITIADEGFNHNLLGIAKTSISKVNDVSMASPQHIERINDVQ
tara:strand:+ start:1221 stop:1979 length:759 start_codon:yes stop_codon:yes gene_type:complete